MGESVWHGGKDSHMHKVGKRNFLYIYFVLLISLMEEYELLKVTLKLMMEKGIISKSREVCIYKWAYIIHPVQQYLLNSKLPVFTLK